MAVDLSIPMACFRSSAPLYWKCPEPAETSIMSGLSGSLGGFKMIDNTAD